MTGGRPRKPDELKLADGTWRKDRDGDPRRAVTAGGEPAAPAYLKGDAAAFWRQVMPGLVASGVAKERDGPELTLMCEWWGRIRKLTRIMDRMRGTDRRLYQTTVMLGIATQNFDRIAARFGLTPGDRAKLREPAGGGQRPTAVPARSRG